MCNRHPSTPFIVFAFALGLVCAPVVAQSPPSPRFNVSDASLRTADRTVRATEIKPGYRRSHHFETWDVDVGADEILFFRSGEGVPVAKTRSPGVEGWKLLTVDDSSAYFFNSAAPIADTNAVRVEQFEIQKGEWRTPLVIRVPEAERAVSLSDAGAKGRRVIFLLFEHTPVRYHAVCLESGREAWRQTWTGIGAEKARHADGVLIAAARFPDRSVAEIQTISVGEHSIAICAHDNDAIRFLDLNSGKRLGQVERVWEFQRAFVGPSVWCNTMARFGLEPNDLGDDTPVDQHARNDFAKFYDGRIVCGPVYSAENWFVFVSTAMPGPYASFRSDCVVYQLRTGPEALAHLPRVPLASTVRASSNGVSCAFLGGGFGMLKRNESEDHGPGSQDCLIRLLWYRDFSAEKRSAWFSSAPGTTEVSYTPSHAFCAVEGGFVSAENDSRYSFPIRRIELHSGASTDLFIDVPFEGTFELPTTNYQRSSGTSLRATGVHLLAITGLGTTGNQLHVTLGEKSSASTLYFSLADLGR